MNEEQDQSATESPADKYDRLMRLADLFDSSGDEMCNRARLGDAVLGDEDVSASEELSPKTYAQAEEDIRAATTGKRGAACEVRDRAGDVTQPRPSRLRASLSSRIARCWSEACLSTTTRVCLTRSSSRVAVSIAIRVRAQSWHSARDGAFLSSRSRSLATTATSWPASASSGSGTWVSTIARSRSMSG